MTPQELQIKLHSVEYYAGRDVSDPLRQHIEKLQNRVEEIEALRAEVEAYRAEEYNRQQGAS